MVRHHERMISGLAGGLLLAALLSGLAGCGDDGDGTTTPPPPEGNRVAGIVRDDAGRPLAGIDVVARPSLDRAVTDAAGAFRLGPFADTDTISLQTESPDTVSAPGADDAWFDYRTEPFAVVGAPPANLVLMTRYGIDCSAVDTYPAFYYEANRGWFTANEPRNWRWPDDAYPLRVYAPVDSVDYEGYVSYPHELAREAAARWNDALGWTTPALRMVDDPDSADIWFEYDFSTRTGCFTSPEPGTGFRTAPPQGVLIVVTNRTGYWWPNNAELIQGVFVHEMGHALGIHHAPDVWQDGQDFDIVMDLSAYAPGYPTVWDIRLVQTKATLPPGALLDHFECWNAPSPIGDFPPLGE